MRLADEIVIVLGGEVIVLHPALRHAIALERKPGGFKRLLDEVQDGSLTAAIELIEPHHGHPLLANRIFDAGLATLMEPLTRYIFACAGIDPDEAAQPKAKGKTLTFAEYLLDLYRIGTGWLGWTPETTLDSTPTEIVEAYKGRADMLRSIFGTSETKQDDRPLGDKFRAFFSSRTAAEKAA